MNRFVAPMCCTDVPGARVGSSAAQDKAGVWSLTVLTGYEHRPGQSWAEHEPIYEKLPITHCPFCGVALPSRAAIEAEREAHHNDPRWKEVDSYESGGETVIIEQLVDDKP